MTKQLEEQCIKLFENIKENIDALFPNWAPQWKNKESKIRFVLNGDGTSNQDYITILSPNDKGNWATVCDIYPSTYKIKFNKDNSNIKLFDSIKRQLDRYSRYRDIEKKEGDDYYKPSTLR